MDAPPAAAAANNVANPPAAAAANNVVNPPAVAAANPPAPGAAAATAANANAWKKKKKDSKCCMIFLVVGKTFLALLLVALAANNVANSPAPGAADVALLILWSISLAMSVVMLVLLCIEK